MNSIFSPGPIPADAEQSVNAFADAIEAYATAIRNLVGPGMANEHLFQEDFIAQVALVRHVAAIAPEATDRVPEDFPGVILRAPDKGPTDVHVSLHMEDMPGFRLVVGVSPDEGQEPFGSWESVAHSAVHADTGSLGALLEDFAWLDIVLMNADGEKVMHWSVPRIDGGDLLEINLVPPTA